MELYILSKQDLSILSICKLAEYQINLDEETNAKSTFTLMKTDGLKKDNFMVLNGLYRQFLFVIDEVNAEKDSDAVTVTALDISNIFDRKVIEKNTDTMTSNSIEEFIANTMSENFVNSDDTALNIGYIDIYWHTNTQATVATNAENGLYNFHTFLINCRQYKNIYTDFKFENERLRIDISYKEETTELIDTTLPEIADYNKIYEEDVTAKVQVYVREDGSEYNLYLKTDRTTTTNKDDPDRANGKIEVISVDTADMAIEEALNVMKGNNYKHLVEFKIAKTSKLMDITKLHIGRPIRIKTEDEIYDSYISAITLSDENFVYFKSGSLRITLLDKLKKNQEKQGNKLDVSGGKISGNLDVNGTLRVKGQSIVATVIDNLNSESTTDALSAKQGKLLNEKIKSVASQNVLWDDYLYMNASQTVNVPISEQKHGIMLMFCAYSGGAPHNWNWSSHVVLKKEAELLNGGGRIFPMGGTQGIDAVKYIYIYPDKIEGNDNNQQDTAKGYVLRKIIGF